MNIYCIQSKSQQWVNLHGHNCVSEPSKADFVVYESAGDNLADINAAKKKFSSYPLVFILSGDVDVSKDNHIYFASTINSKSSRKTQIYTHNPRIVDYVKLKCHRAYTDARMSTGMFSGTLWSDIPSRVAIRSLPAPWYVQPAHNYWSMMMMDRREVSFNTYDAMQRYKYGLCPRGKGGSSMRIAEALACGCIPILIDDFSDPFEDNFNDIVIRCTSADVPHLNDIVADHEQHSDIHSEDCIKYAENTIFKDYIENSNLHWTVCTGFSSKIIERLNTL